MAVLPTLYGHVVNKNLLHFSLARGSSHPWLQRVQLENLKISDSFEHWFISKRIRCVCSPNLISSSISGFDKLSKYEVTVCPWSLLASWLAGLPLHGSPLQLEKIYAGPSNSVHLGVRTFLCRQVSGAMKSCHKKVDCSAVSCPVPRFMAFNLIYTFT